jgi:hypothetical protein
MNQNWTRALFVTDYQSIRAIPSDWLHIDSDIKKYLHQNQLVEVTLFC